MSEYGEPWRLDIEEHECLGGREEIAIVRDNLGNLLAHDAEYNEYVFDRDELSRIVACVNACRGISTERLLAIPSKVEEFAKSIDREMSNDLKSYKAMCDLGYFPPDPFAKEVPHESP